MSKNVKYILLAVIVLVVLIVGIPFFGGMITGVNPNKAIQLANQKKAENASKGLYVPTGYSLVENAKKDDLDGVSVYTTVLKSDTNTITIIQQPIDNLDCKGNTLQMANRNVCHIETSYQNNPIEYYIWSGNGSKYQMGMGLNSLSRDEVAKVIESL